MIGPSGFGKAPKSSIKKLVVTDMRTGEVVRSIDVSDKNDTQIEKVESGMLRNMDIENYCINLVTT